MNAHDRVQNLESRAPDFDVIWSVVQDLLTTLMQTQPVANV